MIGDDYEVDIIGARNVDMKQIFLILIKRLGKTAARTT